MDVNIGHYPYMSKARNTPTGSKAMYEVNTGGRSYNDTNASLVASVAATWSRLSFEPEAYAIVEVNGLIECRQIPVTTAHQTAKALVAIAAS